MALSSYKRLPHQTGHQCQQIAKVQARLVMKGKLKRNMTALFSHFKSEAQVSLQAKNTAGTRLWCTQPFKGLEDIP